MYNITLFMIKIRAISVHKLSKHCSNSFPYVTLFIYFCNVKIFVLNYVIAKSELPP